MKIKLMSFNTQHCLNYRTRNIDFDIMARTITEIGADIIGLNEMRGKGISEDYTDQTAELAERTGFNFYFAKAIDVHGCDPYGNAILSRYPIISAETVMIPDPEIKKYGESYETRCLLKAEIDVPGGLSVMVTHFGLNPDEAENAVKTVVSNYGNNRCVLMGDFNLTPESKILDPIKKIFLDTAELFPGERLSFPSDKPEIKIDYIYTTKDINVISADILPIIASDHRPHIADIEINRSN